MSETRSGTSDLLTVDELAAATGLTVRTTRYYAGLGLLPPPERRGRVAYYSATHQARLELIRALQDHGFTLAAIEGYLARVPLDASAEDLAVQRSMLTSWTAGSAEPLTRRQLDKRAARRISDDELDLLLRLDALRLEGERFVVLPSFDVAVELISLDIPVDSVIEASAAIKRHMDPLVDELTAVLQERVVGPFRGGSHSPAEKADFERMLAQLRVLTLEAVVAGFRRAADEVIARSLSRRS